MALGGGFRKPIDDARFSWTSHVVSKMREYAIPESRIRRIIRHPARTEEGIAPDTVAVMQPGGTTRYHEIWVMYRVMKVELRETPKTPPSPFASLPRSAGKIRVITAWRYPGRSPERDPVPPGVLAEVEQLL